MVTVCARAAGADREGAEVDRVRGRFDDRPAALAAERRREAVAVSGRPQFGRVGDRVLGAEVDFDVTALTGFQRVAAAVAVAGPEGAGAAVDFEVVDLHRGFAAVDHLQVGVAVFVDPLQAEVVAGGREGQLRLDRVAGDLKALLGPAGLEGDDSVAFLTPTLFGLSANQRPQFWPGKIGAATAGGGEAEFARVFAFDRDLVDRRFFSAFVVEAGASTLWAWLPTVVFAKLSAGGETSSGRPLPSGGAARLEAGATSRARTNAETAISLVMPAHRKNVQKS